MVSPASPERVRGVGVKKRALTMKRNELQSWALLLMLSSAFVLGAVWLSVQVDQRKFAAAQPWLDLAVRDLADRLISCFGSMLLYWWHYAHSGKRVELETDDDTVAGHFLHVLHGRKPDELTRRALDVSLILYAEHEFNASTFSARVTAS